MPTDLIGTAYDGQQKSKAVKILIIKLISYKWGSINSLLFLTDKLVLKAGSLRYSLIFIESNMLQNNIRCCFMLVYRVVSDVFNWSILIDVS